MIAVSGAAHAQDTIKIGMTQPLTGPVAASGNFVANGANQLNGPSFELDKPDEAYDEARLAALKKAQTRARTYASALGLNVRRIVSISEGGASFPRPMPMMRAMAADAGFAKETSVSPGETTLSVNIDVVFELGR